MARTLNEVVASPPRRERAKIEARARRLIAEEMPLRDLRKAIGKTQATVARRLGIGQEAVSRLEMRGDMHLSTLRNMLEAMGGELELLAHFPGWPPARLTVPGAAPRRRKTERRAAALALLPATFAVNGTSVLVEKSRYRRRPLTQIGRAQGLG